MVSGMRFSGVDLVRILAACGVIWAHLPAATHKEIAHAGLVAFVVITVVFQVLGSEKRSFSDYMGRRSIRVLVPWAAWFVIYGILNRVKGAEWFPFSEGVLMNILTGPWIGLWYLPFILIIAPLVFGLSRLASRLRNGLRVLVPALSGAVVLWASSLFRNTGAVYVPIDQWIQIAAAIPLGIAIGFSLVVPFQERGKCLLGVVGLVVATCFMLFEIDRGMAISFGLAIPGVVMGFRFSPSLHPAIKAAAELCMGVYLIHAIVIGFMKSTPAKGLGTPMQIGIVAIVSFALVFLFRKNKMLRSIV